MRKILVLVLFALLLPCGAYAQGVPSAATVVASCGSTPTSYTAGQVKSLLMNTTGLQCTNAGSTIINLPKGNTFAPAHTALSTSAVQVLTSGTFAARTVCNLDASIMVWIGSSDVTASVGQPVPPGNCYDVTSTTVAVYAIAASGTPNMSEVQY